MKIAKSYVILGLASFFIISIPNSNTFAQGVLSEFGCGTGCLTRQRQLSEIISMPNGFRRALVETQTFVYTQSGFAPCTPSNRCDGNLKKVWVVADCSGSSKVNLGAYKSDGSDGFWLDAFNSSGGRADSTAEGKAYSHWAAICKDGEIESGTYWPGAWGEGLKIEGNRYQYYSETGSLPWEPISNLKHIKSGVVYGEGKYWCLSSMKQHRGLAVCSADGWITSPSR